MKELNILGHWEIFNEKFTIYGTIDEPLFLAKEVAKLIEHTQVVRMIENIDSNEKVMNNVHTPGGIQNCWFLTEDGLYEVLMQSRKPIAKQFKAKVKEILKEIRKTGTYSTKPQQSLPACIEDLIIQQATLLKDLRIKVESQQQQIDQLAHKPFSQFNTYRSCEAWLFIKNIPYQKEFFWAFSRRCAKYSRDNNIPVHRTDKKGYVVNAYRDDVLERCFGNKLALPAPKPQRGKNVVYLIAEVFNAMSAEMRLAVIKIGMSGVTKFLKNFRVVSGRHLLQILPRYRNLAKLKQNQSAELDNPKRLGLSNSAAINNQFTLYKKCATMKT